MPAKLSCVALPTRLPANTALTLYRIPLEALKNVEHHASARDVKVRLKKQASVCQLVIHDDGTAFDQENHPATQDGKFPLGLVCMRERATYSGATLQSEISLRQRAREGRHNHRGCTFRSRCSSECQVGFHPITRGRLRA